MFDQQQQFLLDYQHATHPTLGDFWHERYSAVCVVLEVTPEIVTICKKKINLGDEAYAWDLDHTTEMDRFEFKKWLSYGTQHGYWAHVQPEHQLWAVLSYTQRCL